MEKYKICPSCGTKNAPTLFECISCEADLTGVNITDEETEKMSAENRMEEPKAAAARKLVRICECGAKNAPNARKCAVCQEDISDITPTLDEVSLSFALVSLDGRLIFKPSAEKTIIGRENAMSEYLSGKSYVSRTHAELTVEADGLYIKNLSETNFTYVNNRKITEKTKLHSGDEIGLGGINTDKGRQEPAAYFTVRVT